MGKLDVIKKLAGLGVAAGAATLLSQEDAQAAGLETIAKMLGVGLEEAAKIKQLAHIAPPNVFEDNIKAIQKVTQYNKDPLAFPKLGSGVDYKALDVGDNQVLKVPKTRTEQTIERQVSPALLESADLGPKTKTIQAGDRTFMLQDKVRPINEIIKKTQRPGQDQVIEDLYKVRDKLWSNVDIHDPKAIEAINQSPDLKKIEDAIHSRENEILKSEGINTNEYANEYNNMQFRDKIRDPLLHPEETLEDLADYRAWRKLGNVIEPNDTHSANIGLGKDNKLQIFDSSRFENLKPQNLTPEMKDAILNSNISVPEKKEALRKLLNPKIKKAAGIAGAIGLTSAPTEKSEAGIINRRFATTLLKNAMEDGKLNVPKLLTSMGVNEKNIFNVETQIKIKDVLGHLAFDRSGLDEEDVHKVIKKFYPEIDLVNPNMISEAPIPWFGQIDTDLTNIMTPKITINDKLDALGKVSTGLHETGHFRQNLKGELFKQDPISKIEQSHKGSRLYWPDPYSKSYAYETPIYNNRIIDNLKDKPELVQELLANFQKYSNERHDINKLTDSNLLNLVKKIPGGEDIYLGRGQTKQSLSDLMNISTSKHHGPTIKNYELEKIKELQEKGMIIPPISEIKNDVLNYSQSQGALQKARSEQIKQLTKATRDIKSGKKAAAFAPLGASDMLSKGGEQIANALRPAADVYNQYVTEPIGKLADYAADKIANATALGSEQGREANRGLAAGGLRMALDPTNYMAPGVGIPLSIGAEYLKSPEDVPLSKEELREQAVNKLKLNNDLKLN